jgi:hypothetical protein
MRTLAFSAIFLFFLSCEKGHGEDSVLDNSKAGILKRNTWVAHRVRTLSIIDSNNAITKDTTVYAEGCALQEWMQLHSDGKASKKAVCMITDPPIMPGTWSLTGDTTLHVNIPFYRSSFGSGVVQGNYGIEPSKLIGISDTAFTVKFVRNWLSWDGNGNMYSFRTEYYSTYHKQ